ncbi:MAG: hypothetical protein IPM34_14320 [Saprospiraceae bacterium]|nr:hypothetical protein [Saprospiraceae bacterium]
MEKMISLQLNINNILFLLIFLGHQTCAQISTGANIILLIDSNKVECPLASSESSLNCTKRWSLASYLLDNYYFTNDSNLLNFFDSSVQYILEKHRPYYRYYIGSARYMEDQLAAYRLSYRMSEYPSQMQLDSSILYRSHILLKYLSDKLPVNQITESYKNHTDVEYRVFLFGGLIRKLSKTKIPEVYHALIDTLLIDRTDYRMVIKLLRDCRIPECDSLLNLEYQRFDTLKDLNNEFDKSLWEDVFNRGDEIRDSLERIKMILNVQRRDDSIRNAMLELENAPFDEALYLSTLDSTDKAQYLIRKDTTLWHDDFLIIRNNETDFKAWSNSALIKKLTKLNPKRFYAICMYNYLKLDEDLQMNQLFIITQIIGDRILNKRYLPNAKQRQFLNQFINEFSKYYCTALHLSSKLHWQSRKQLLRLWPLLNEPVLDWLVHPDTCYNILAKDLLICIFSEELVKAIIYKMDFPANKKEKSYKETYFNALKLLYNYDETESHVILLDLPPRRPLRNARQTQDWIDRLIEPARIRHGISEVDN